MIPTPYGAAAILALAFFGPYFLLFLALPFLTTEWLIALLPVMEFYIRILT
jgi:hypothetical protein